VKSIQLVGGLEALVDDEDYELVSQYTWTPTRSKAQYSWYAEASVIAPERGKHANGDTRRRRIKMHTLILQTASDLVPDHVNGNGLDNRRSNLRPATGSQNMFNTRRRSDNRSGFKGVSWARRDKRWRAFISVAGKAVCLGDFKSKVAAAIEYNIHAVRVAGEFARLNDAFSGEVPL
jgi:hypothetical protein